MPKNNKVIGMSNCGCSLAVDSPNAHRPECHLFKKEKIIYLKGTPIVLTDAPYLPDGSNFETTLKEIIPKILKALNEEYFELYKESDGLYPTAMQFIDYLAEKYGKKEK